MISEKAPPAYYVWPEVIFLKGSHDIRTGHSGRSDKYGLRYIPMPSLTQAIRARRLLERSGLRAFTARDRSVNDEGCGYLIRLYGGDTALERAKALLRGSGIPFGEYRPEGGGGA